MPEVCHDVKVEPHLNELSGETLQERTANTTSEARLDISARDFWIKHQRAFFDIRVFNPTARRYDHLSTKKAYEINEREKKRHYNERVLEIEQGSFSPMVFSAFGGMARECSMVFKRLIDLLADKRKINTSLVASWVRRKVNFSIMKSLICCVRGTRYPWYKENIVETIQKDIDLSEVMSKISN